MSLAESDACVNVQRIEHHPITAARLRHLFRGRMRQTVGAAEDECVERQPGIERGAAEGLVSHRNRGGGISYLRTCAPGFPDCGGVVFVPSPCWARGQHTPEAPGVA